MTAEEFKIQLQENDELCHIAQTLSDQDAVLHTTDLIVAKDYIRQRYLDEAQKIIDIIKKAKLSIIHESKL